MGHKAPRTLVRGAVTEAARHLRAATQQPPLGGVKWHMISLGQGLTPVLQRLSILVDANVGLATTRLMLSNDFRYRKLRPVWSGWHQGGNPPGWVHQECIRR